MNIAFLVGCGQYQNFPNLPGVNNNIKRMRELFIKRCDCQEANVSHIMDGDSDPMKSDGNVYYPNPGDIYEILLLKKGEFNRKIDNLFFYFVGHGFVSNNGKVMLAMKNTRIFRKGSASQTGAFPLEDIHRILEGFQARNVIYFLDMCLKSENDTMRTEDSFQSFPNSIVFYSCQLGETATMNGDGSVFTNCLAETFQKREALSVLALDRHLQAALESNNQRPHMEANHSDDLDRIMITSELGNGDELLLSALYSEDDISRHILRIKDAINELYRLNDHIDVFLKCIVNNGQREKFLADQTIRNYADAQSDFEKLLEDLRNMAARYYAYVQTCHADRTDRGESSGKSNSDDYSYIKRLADEMSIAETGVGFSDEQMWKSIQEFYENISRHREKIGADLKRMSELKRNAELLRKKSDDFSNYSADGHGKNTNLLIKMKNRSNSLRSILKEKTGKKLDLLDGITELLNDVKSSLDKYVESEKENILRSLKIHSAGFRDFDIDYEDILKTIRGEMESLLISYHKADDCLRKIREGFGYTGKR